MKKQIEVIIIGGSFAGLSAALTLGRSLTPTLVIDAGNPCNAPTPHAHNLLTHDGKIPAEISMLGKKDVEKYDHVEFLHDTVLSIQQTSQGFELQTLGALNLSAQQIIFASGVKDILPEIPGFAQCWGKTIIHCPYCHGYEAKDTKAGIFGKGEQAFEKAKMIYHWNKNLSLFANGPHELTLQQLKVLEQMSIPVVEKKITSFKEDKGILQGIKFTNDEFIPLANLYAIIPTQQPHTLASSMGVDISEGGHITTNEFQMTNIPNILAAGDGTTPMRSLSQAIAQGNIAGVVANRNYLQKKYTFE